MKTLLLALAIAAGACGPGDPPIARVDPPKPSGRPALRGDKPLSPRIASYQLEAVLDAEAKRIAGKGTLTWRHTGTAPVSELPFHLYMNAFKNERSAFIRESGGQLRGNEMNEDDPHWGWIELPSLRFEGKELRPGARFGDDETTLTVPLPRAVAPGETITLEMTFTTQLPEAFARTGFMGKFMMVGQWFPKIGVLSGDVWHCDTFHANSEFFADFGVYDVVIDAPDTHVVVATGVLTAVNDAGGRRRHAYHAEDVHDFVWMADPWMQITAGKAGDIDIFVVHRPGQAAFAARHLEAARRTLETYSRLFYPYPWTSMTVVDPPHDVVWAVGGMEYPTLVTTAGDLAIDGVNLPELVTIHEVGHNWFQGLIASNEVDEAWLDEGLNEYTNGIVMDEWWGEDKSALARGGLTLGYYRQHVSSDFAPLVKPTRTRSYEFAPNDYGRMTYDGTLKTLRTLEGLVGRQQVHAALGVYARRFAFQHPTGEDFLAVMRDELGEPALRFLRAALEGTALPDYRVVEMDSHRVRAARGVFGEGAARKTVAEAEPEGETREHVVVVENAGGLAVPVDVELRFEDGHVETRRWDGVGFVRLVVSHPARLASVEVDPKHAVLLEQERLLNGKYAEPQAGPPLRASLRAGFWEQTLLQVVGL